MRGIASRPHFLAHERDVGAGEEHDRRRRPGRSAATRRGSGSGRAGGCSAGPRSLSSSTRIPVLWRAGLRSTPVASLYSWSGDRRRTASSRRALSSTSCVVGSEGTLVHRVGHHTGDQTAEQREHEPDRDRRECRRRRPPAHHRQQQRERQPQRDVDDGDDVERKDPHEIAARRPDTEAHRAVRRRRWRSTQPRASAIAPIPADELAVDDLVAVDRLGDQAGQRALGALAVDRVEAEGDPEQRAEDAEELVERRHALGREREQVAGRPTASASPHRRHRGSDRSPSARRPARRATPARGGSRTAPNGRDRRTPCGR